jgi:hypothetical protein
MRKTGKAGRRAPWVGLGVALWLLAPGTAGALTLLPGQSLEIDFSFASAPQVTLPGPTVVAPDTLTFRVLTGTVSGLQGVNIFLEDGGSSLGVDASSLANPIWAFTDSASAWPVTLNRTDVDFSSILDGSIQGLVRLTPVFAPLAATPQLELTFTEVLVGLATSAGGFVPADPSIAVATPRIVPEPSTALLLAAVAGLWGRAGRSRR